MNVSESLASVASTFRFTSNRLLDVQVFDNPNAQKAFNTLFTGACVVGGVSLAAMTAKLALITAPLLLAKIAIGALLTALCINEAAHSVLANRENN
jgi:hypothetical protein